MLIDTHCHLNFKVFDDDLDDIVRRSINIGIKNIIIPGTDIASSTRAIEIAQKYPNCFAAIGIHPHHAKDTKLIINNLLKEKLTILLQKEKVIAVGEIGLDYYYYKKTKYIDATITEQLKQKQKKLLILQLELAQKHNFPVILHCRDAHDDLFMFFANNSYLKIRGVFHCFGGNIEHLKKALAMEFYIGFDGNITYNKNLHCLVQKTPIEKIILETDSPYLTPIPFRGKRNEPKNLMLIAQHVAKLKKLPISQVKKQTTLNAKKLFSIL